MDNAQVIHLDVIKKNLDINVLEKEIVVRVSETKIDDFGIKTIKTSGTSSIVKQVLNHFRELSI